MAAVTVTPHPQQQQHEGGHPEMHDEVVARHRGCHRVVGRQPRVHRPGPADVQPAVEGEHLTPMREPGRYDVAVQ
jgi:hypothetical protein